jgi:hypothetical protein
MAQSSRARLFVVFLDTYHVEIEGSHAIEAARRRARRGDRPDDLVARDDAGDVGRRRHLRAQDDDDRGLLTRYWHWGERDRMTCPGSQDRTVRRVLSERRR